MPVADAKTLERVAQGLKRSGSILAQAATVYGAKPEQPEATPGTGFDPVAAALFEALIEGAYLVASADGVVDDEERAAFEQVVASAAATGSSVHTPGTGAQLGQIQAGQVHALLSDLQESLQEDGLERRVEIVTKSVIRPEHRTEVLRVAALVAHVSGGVSAPERAILEKLAVGLELTNGDVDQAVSEATSVLGD